MSGFYNVQRRFVLFVLLVLIAAAGVQVIAQESPPDTDNGGRVVTDDEVNAIAEKLYCPVCENIPLDVCGTPACSDWRYEIRLQLQSGMTEKQIIDDFVDRFGDRVVGTPQNPVLRLLSLVTPWIAIAAGLYFGARFLFSRRLRAGEQEAPYSSSPPDDETTYRDVLEQDVAG